MRGIRWSREADKARHAPKHARWEQRTANPLACQVPTVEDGLRGMQFIEAVMASNCAGGRWTAVV